MIFYFSTGVSVRVEGGEWRRYRCQACGGDYRFYIHKAVTCSRQAPYSLNKRGAEKAARRDAEAALADRFENEIEPVPCPTCGEYQAAMVPALFAERFRWVSNVFVAALCLTPILFVAGVLLLYDLTDMAKRKDEFLNDWLIVTLPAACAAVTPLILLKVYQRQRAALFHPNVDIPVEDRIALGQRMAEPVLPDED